MFKGIKFDLLRDPVWVRVINLSLVLFFLYTSDAILSYWIPGFVQEKLTYPLLMGFVLSFSSFVGFIFDLILPQWLKNITVGKLLFWSIIVSAAFALNLVGSTFLPVIAVLLLAMSLWGIYFEFIMFASQQFVADAVPLRMHASGWAVIGVVRSLAYFLGPLIAGYALLISDRSALYVALLFTSLSFVSLQLSGKKNERKLDIEPHQVSLLRELEHWKVLLEHIWPVVVISLFIGIVDAVFWTTGAVYSESFSGNNLIGRWFLPMYTLPSIFTGFIIAKMGIFKGKKKLSFKLVLISCFVLSALGLVSSLAVQLIIVFISSVFMTLSWPLVDGVYSDIVARMGRENKI